MSDTHRRIGSLLRPILAVLAAFAVSFALPSLTAAPAQAYLSIIRQGAESRGSRETGDLHGRSVATGDFNRDGFDDLAAGAPFEDVDGRSLAGAVVVNFGSPFGLKREGAQLLLQSDGHTLQQGAQFGWALAAGDFDDDGYDDLAIGAPGVDADPDHVNTGLVLVYAGGPGGLSYWHYLWQPAGGGVPESNDAFGYALCAGNFDGLSGTNADLAIGSPGEDGDAGVVFWFTGSTQGLLNGSSGWFKQSTLGGTNVAGDRFGYSLAAGQMEGGLYEDLVVGAPFKEVDGVTDAGVVWRVVGSSTGPNTATARMIRPDEGDLPNAPYPEGWFGWSVAAGRFWGGNYDGLAIGEPGRSYFGHPRSGRVVVGKGGLFGISFSGGNEVTFFQDDVGWGLAPNDGFGRTLAAGYYDAVDGGEELIIGSPTDNSNGAAGNSGVISVVFGGPSGPGSHGYLSWAQDAFSDDIAANDQFGTSLAVGRFDDTGWGNLAVGAPGEDSSTGQVVIVAPWRQHLYDGGRAFLAADCEGNWVLAHKPFDELQIASTTKIMTVLLACERMSLPTNDPNYVSPSTTYDVPDWIREHIGGSRYEFFNDQRVTLWDLVHCCIFPSGNDAAYAIADLLTGSINWWGGAYDNTCQLFVGQMNARAAQLGMTHTDFTNPAGLDKGNPYSCAADLWRLARAAMDNALFRTVVGSTSYTFNTSAVFGGIRVDYQDTINYGWLQSMQSYNPGFDGIKPGRTPKARRTGVFSNTPGWLDPALAVSLGHEERAGIRASGDALMDLALAACGGNLARPASPAAPLLASANPPLSPVASRSPLAEEEGFRLDYGSLSTYAGDRAGGGAELPPAPNPDHPWAQIDLLRPTGDGLTECSLEALRSGELELSPNRQATLGVGPFQSHGGLGFINHGDSTITILVETPHTGTPLPFTLEPGERGSIEPYHGSQAPEFRYTIRNASPSAVAVVGVLEHWIWDIDGIPAGPNPFFSADLRLSDAMQEQAFRLLLTGTDPVPGRTVHLSIHDDDVLVDASDVPRLEDGNIGARGVYAFPNPFTTATRISYALNAPGKVGLEIYGVAGRRVRAFELPHAQAGSAFFDWDGSTDEGHAAAPGVYFYRMTHNGHEAGRGRVTLVR